MSSNSQEFDPVDLGGLLLDAYEQGDLQTAAKILCKAVLHVLHQIDEDQPESDLEDDDDGSLHLVVAESDGEVALICFTADEHIDTFMATMDEELPEEFEVPVIVMEGQMLLESLPDDMGLLVNPGTELECYFPAGALPRPSLTNDTEEE